MIFVLMDQNNNPLQTPGVPVHEVVWTLTGHNMSIPIAGSAHSEMAFGVACVGDTLSAGPGGEIPIAEGFIKKTRSTKYVKTKGGAKVPLLTIETELRGGPAGLTFHDILPIQPPTLADPPDMESKTDSGGQ